MHKNLQLRDDIDRLFVSRKEGGRGFACIENNKVATIQGLKEYSKKIKERLITGASHSTGNIRTNRKTAKTRKQEWEEKQLYGYFKRQTGGIVHEMNLDKHKKKKNFK